MKTSRPIIYQLLPRLFGHAKGENKPNGTIEENGCGKFNYITSKALQSISSLGATHIWYTGIMEHATKTDYSSYGIAKDVAEVIKGEAGSPYAIKDYYDVDPDLAENVANRMAEFQQLVKRTHDNGLKVIIDWVPNHLARNYVSDAAPKGTLAFGDNDDSSKHFDANNNYYYLPGTTFKSPVSSEEEEEKWHEEPVKVTGNDCFSPTPSINDWYETIKLNYGVDVQNGSAKHFDPIPDTWTKMLEVILFWAEKGVDGFRCDMAGMVPLEFWLWSLSKIKEKYPAVIFIAEVYEASKYKDFLDAGFDYLYDKVVMYDEVRKVMGEKSSVSSITHAWQQTEGLHNSLLYFIENHDEQRVASEFFANNAQIGIPAMTVMACMFNNPLLIYFGQELGEKGMEAEGFSGLDGRTTIFDYWSVKTIDDWRSGGTWSGENLEPSAKELRDDYKNILQLINKETALTSNGFYDVMWANKNNSDWNSDRMFAFLRYGKDQCLLVIANFSPHENSYRLIIPEDAFNHAGVNVTELFTGTDLLKMNADIHFPGEVATAGGLGGKIKGYSAAIYNLTWS
ncbi:MAG TPA: alpha-amylase family glycosyl hydrolase, partial [Marinilabiliaceae bacterium]|nr:alpha-amylase family glycosyl hydrolase [Marinilabiliaceae bacterium]